MQQLDQIH